MLAEKIRTAYVVLFVSPFSLADKFDKSNTSKLPPGASHTTYLSMGAEVAGAFQVIIAYLSPSSTEPCVGGFGREPAVNEKF